MSSILSVRTSWLKIDNVCRMVFDVCYVAPWGQTVVGFQTNLACVRVCACTGLVRRKLALNGFHISVRDDGTVVFFFFRLSTMFTTDFICPRRKSVAIRTRTVLKNVHRPTWTETAIRDPHVLSQSRRHWPATMRRAATKCGVRRSTVEIPNCSLSFTRNAFL